MSLISQTPPLSLPIYSNVPQSMRPSRLNPILFPLLFIAKQATVSLAEVPQELSVTHHILSWAGVDTPTETVVNQFVGRPQPSDLEFPINPLTIRNLIESFRVTTFLKRGARLTDLKDLLKQRIPVLVLCQTAPTNPSKRPKFRWWIAQYFNDATNDLSLLDAEGNVFIQNADKFQKCWQFAHETSSLALLKRHGITPSSMVWAIRKDAVNRVGSLAHSTWRSLAAKGIDAIVKHPTSKATFLFQQDQFFQYHPDRDTIDPPRLINDHWKGLPSNLDAAVGHPNGKVYFFKGEHYYRFSFEKNAVDKIGRIGVDGWRGLEAPIDAAISHPNGKAYFFCGERYFRFNFSSDRTDKLATIDQEGWRGVPHHLRAAFLHPNGKGYLFKTESYFEFTF